MPYCCKPRHVRVKLTPTARNITFVAGQDYASRYSTTRYQRKIMCVMRKITSGETQN